MSLFVLPPTTPPVLRVELPLLDEAQFAAPAFLARYNGRTLESYRADLRQYFQWADGVGLSPLAVTRAHVELYRAWMEQRGLASSTIDRRLSTVRGYHRFAHIDGRITSNPAQYVRRPRVHPSTQRGMDRGELASFLYTAERISPMHAALAVCGGGLTRSHRMPLRVIGCLMFRVLLAFGKSAHAWLASSGWSRPQAVAATLVTPVLRRRLTGQRQSLAA